MQNYGDVQKYLTIETESAGVAQRNYAVYLEGVEAAQNRVTAATEEFWQKAISSGNVSVFYNLVATVIEWATALGGLDTILIAVAMTLLVVNHAAISNAIVWVTEIIPGVWAVIRAFVALVWQNGLLATSFEMLNLSNPAGWIAILIGAVYLAVKAYQTWWPSIEKTTAEIEKQTKAIDELKDKQKSSNDLIGTFESLKTKKEKEGLNEDETQQLIDVQNQLKELFPDLLGYYDEYGNFLISTTDSISDQVKALDDLIKARQREKQALLDASAEMNAQTLMSKALTPGSGGRGGLTSSQIQKIQLDWGDAIAESKAAFEQMSDEGRTAFIVALVKTGEQGKKLAEDIFIPLMRKINEMKENPPVIPIEGEVTATVIVSDESKKAFEELVDTAVEMIKQTKTEEKDALQAQIDGLEKEATLQKQIYEDRLNQIKTEADAEKLALQRQMEDRKRLYDQQKKAISDQLAAYKKIIDAERTRLKLEKERHDFEAGITDKTSELSAIQSQIAELQYDDSEEAKSKRLELESQAADIQKSIADDQYNYEYDLQQQALDNQEKLLEDAAQGQLDALAAEEAAYQRQYDLQMRSIEDRLRVAQQQYDIFVTELERETNAQKAALEIQIKAIDDYLKQEGTIRNDAKNMIMSQSDEVFNALIEWNREYGTGINETITQMWYLATAAVKAYSSAVSGIPEIQTGYITPEGTSGILPTGVHHSGIDSGFVGGAASTRSGEEFAKLMQGELVINASQMDNFMQRLLPGLMGASPSMSSNISGGNTITIPINVSGSLDERVLPKLEVMIERVVSKLNDNLTSRGFSRTANQFSI